MSLPSIRECEQHLQALADTPASGEALQRAVSVGRALLHYVRNAGTQPSAPASPKLQAQSLPLRPRSVPMHLVRPMQQLPRPRLTRSAAEPQTISARPCSMPSGVVTVKLLSERIHRGKEWISTAIHKGDLPPPDGKTGRLTWWHEATIVTWLRTRPNGAPKACGREHRQAPPPAGMLTLAQIAARSGISVSYLRKHLGTNRFPPADDPGGGRFPALWHEATVARALADRPLRTGSPNSGRPRGERQTTETPEGIQR